MEHCILYPILQAQKDVFNFEKSINVILHYVNHSSNSLVIECTGVINAMLPIVNACVILM